MGHVIAFGHYDAIPGTMNTQHPFGGELGHPDVANFRWNIHENDFAGLRYVKPHSNTGFNVTAGKFYMNTSDNEAVEQWTSTAGVEYDKSQQNWVGGTAPRPPQLVYQGTGSATVFIEWRLSTNTECDDNDPLVGTRSPTMGANVPYARGPYSWDFTDPAITPGNYYLCVRVDPNNVLIETWEQDNFLLSAARHVEVVP